MNNRMATKDDWNTEQMPKRHKTFKINLHFSEDEIEKLKTGHIPQDMEDRWFGYFENGKIHIFRSWSGVCIYIVKFNFEKNIHCVTVNRNKKQYENRDTQADNRIVSHLLKQWSQPDRDR